MIVNKLICYGHHGDMRFLVSLSACVKSYLVPLTNTRINDLHIAAVKETLRFRACTFILSLLYNEAKTLKMELELLPQQEGGPKTCMLG